MLVDVDRRLLIGVLAVLVYASTVLVGVLGPWTQQEYLVSGTLEADAYIELQPGIITAITIVLAINQLVLSPSFGPVSHTRKRLDDAISHHANVEDVTEVLTTSSDPPEFLATIVEASRQHARHLRDVVADGDNPAVEKRVDELVDRMLRETDDIRDALSAARFRKIEMLGAAIHYDTNHELNEFRNVKRNYVDSLSTVQAEALNDMLTVLQLYTVSREYFRTIYIRLEFVRFSRAMLYTGLPALMVAHYSVGVIGPNVLPGYTFGVRNLLWLEAGTFTATMLPIFVIVSYVARLVTLAETSLFLGPFIPGRGDGENAIDQ